MGYDSQGNFSRVHNWEDDRRNDIEIVTDHHDEEDDNFAAGLSQCFLRDGRVAMQDDFDAGNFQLKNVREATLDKDAVNFKQLKDQIAALKTTLLSNVNNGLKVGDIKHSLQTANHDNWLLCNGQEKLSGLILAPATGQPPLMCRIIAVVLSECWVVMRRRTFMPSRMKVCRILVVIFRAIMLQLVRMPLVRFIR